MRTRVKLRVTLRFILIPHMGSLKYTKYKAQESNLSILLRFVLFVSMRFKSFRLVRGLARRFGKGVRKRV